MKILSGNSNPRLSQAISKYLGIPILNCEFMKFADGEFSVSIQGNVENQKVYVIQSTCAPAPENIMELLLLLNELKGAGASHVTAVLPYFAYGRQDQGKAPPAILLGELMKTAGAQSLIIFEVHKPEMFESFPLPTVHLELKDFYGNFVKGMDLPNPMIVSPDCGGVLRAKALAEDLGWPLAILKKGRSAPNICHISSISEDVRGYDCLLFDDICDTGGTLSKGALALMDAGASSVRALCAHGVLSNGALQTLNDSVLKDIYLSNSIALNINYEQFPKVHEMCLGSFIGKAIRDLESGCLLNAAEKHEFRVAIGKI